MARSLLSEAPAILTADGKAVTIGSIVWGVDTACSKDRIPKVEELTVIQTDLGSRRQVRLRRHNGTEYTWSAQEHKHTCQTAEHLIYGNRKNAVAIARKAATEFLTTLKERNGSLQEKLSDHRREHQRNVKNTRKEHASKDKVAKDYAKLIASIR